MWLKHRSQLDPLTGDTITRQERLSLVAQSVLRKWSFVAAYTALTFVWWTHPSLFGDHPGNDARWQDWASYMALLIESLVGIGMFGWARRDSLVIRKLYALERAAEQRDETDQALMHVIAKHTEALFADAQTKAAAAHATAHAAANDAQAAAMAAEAARRRADAAAAAVTVARRDADAADSALVKAQQEADAAQAALVRLEERRGDT